MNDNVMKNRIRILGQEMYPSRSLLIGQSFWDILLGCFGAILSHQKSGKEIKLLIVSQEPDIQSKSFAVLKLLKDKIGDTQDLNFLDSRLGEQSHIIFKTIAELTDFFRNEITVFSPDRVYFSFPGASDTKDVFLFESIRQVIHDSGQDIELALYERDRSCLINEIIDITECKLKKAQIYQLYQGLFGPFPRAVDPMIMNQFRAGTIAPGLGFVEGFFTILPGADQDNFFDLIPCATDKLDAGEGIGKNPLVSIIIRTKDRPALLREAILSVISQTYPTLEIIVVNDGGQDVSALVKQSSGSVVCHYIDHGKTRGRSAAINSGLEKSRGKYINLLDDDDLLYPHHVTTLVRYLEHNRFKAVYSDCELGYYFWNGHKYELKEKKDFLGEPFDLGKLLHNNIIPSMNIMFQRELVESVGLFDEGFDIYEDWDFWIRIAKKYPVYRLAGITAQYRQFEHGSVGQGGRGYDFLYWTRLIQQKHFYPWGPDALALVDFLKEDRHRECTGLQHTINEKTHEIERYAAVVQNRDQEIQKLSTLVQEHKEKINTLVQKHDSLVSKHELVQQSLEEKDKQIHQKNSEIHQRNGDIAHRQNLIDRKEELLHKHDQKDVLIGEKVNAMYDENMALKMENQDLYERVNDLSCEMENQFRQMTALSKELSGYRRYDNFMVCRRARQSVDFLHRIHTRMVRGRIKSPSPVLEPDSRQNLYPPDHSEFFLDSEQPTGVSKQEKISEQPRTCYHVPEREDSSALLLRQFSGDDFKDSGQLQVVKEAQIVWELKQNIPLIKDRYLGFYMNCRTDNLSRIDLWFGTHDRINIGKIVLCIYADNQRSNLLRKASIPAPCLLNNDCASFNFRPILSCREKLLYMSLFHEDFPDASDPAHLSVWYGHYGSALERQYFQWAEKMIPWQKNDIADMQNSLAELSYQPVISLLMPVYKVDTRWLEMAIQSVLNQAYPYWELLVVDDASQDDAIKQMLDDFSQSDPRIKCQFSIKNQGISLASNAALEMATGEFTGLLDHDDLLTADALFEVVALLNVAPDLDMVYSDEDKITVDGRLVEPFFKPGWSPDLLLSCMYTCHFSVYRTQLIRQVDGFRKGFEGSQDYDLALRITEKTQKIGHIPKILYHWRKIPGSTASVYTNKNYARKAAMKSLTQALSRRDISGRVMDGLNENTFRVKRDLKEKPLVSIIIPFKDKVDLLKQCIESIYQKTDYANFEILCINNNSREKDTLSYIEVLQNRKEVRVIDYPFVFNYSAINNFAVNEARGEMLLLLNNDIEVIREDWMTAMLEHAVRNEVGAVGAQLLYPDNRIQHAGVVTGVGGVAGHAFKYIDVDQRTYYFGLANAIRNVNCVTAACLMMRKSVFEQVGGLDEKNLKVAFNDVDLCLKIRDKGYQIIYTPFACLYHHESASRGNATDPREVAFVKRKWSDRLLADPYYSPNLTLDREDFSLNTGIGK